MHLALGLLPVFGSAQPNPQVLTPIQINDPALASLMQEALGRNPELARDTARIEAEKERVPQATALPDPSLSLGLLNDGFKKLQIGMMESSYYQVMLTQPLPWAGEITKVRYEVGQGSQADLLRAQLEQNRLRQTRLALDSEEKGLLAALNRLRGTAPDSPIPTVARLEDTPLQVLPAQVWLERAEMECCEIQDARIALKQSERSLELAKRDRYPDFAVTAGVMPRGSFEPMWQVGISIPCPCGRGRSSSAPSPSRDGASAEANPN